MSSEPLQHTAPLLIGLTGFPLGHSFSRQWFAEKFRRCGIRDIEYVNLPAATPEELTRLLEIENLAGFNVTAPYKTEIIRHLDALDPTAQAIGAVNCVVRNGNSWRGYNTDWEGFMQSLCEFIEGQPKSAKEQMAVAEGQVAGTSCGGERAAGGLQMAAAEGCGRQEASPHGIAASKNLSALILGSGGAARAAAYALTRLSIDFVFVSRSADKGVADRNRDKGVADGSADRDFAGENTDGIFADGDAASIKRADTIGYSQLTREVLAERRLIVNATPLGTFPESGAAPAIPYEYLTPQHLLYDMVYNPPLTEFLRRGREHGATVTNGLRMLELQAEGSWQLFQSARLEASELQRILDAAKG